MVFFNSPFLVSLKKNVNLLLHFVGERRGLGISLILGFSRGLLKRLFGPFVRLPRNRARNCPPMCVAGQGPHRDLARASTNHTSPQVQHHFLDRQVGSGTHEPALLCRMR